MTSISNGTPTSIAGKPEQEKTRRIAVRVVRRSRSSDDAVDGKIHAGQPGRRRRALSGDKMELAVKQSINLDDLDERLKQKVLEKQRAKANALSALQRKPKTAPKQTQKTVRRLGMEPPKNGDGVFVEEKKAPSRSVSSSSTSSKGRFAPGRSRSGPQLPSRSLSSSSSASNERSAPPRRKSGILAFFTQ